MKRWIIIGSIGLNLVLGFYFLSLRENSRGGISVASSRAPTALLFGSGATSALAGQPQDIAKPISQERFAALDTESKQQRIEFLKEKRRQRDRELAEYMSRDMKLEERQIAAFVQYRDHYNEQLSKIARSDSPNKREEIAKILKERERTMTKLLGQKELDTIKWWQSGLKERVGLEKWLEAQQKMRHGRTALLQSTQVKGKRRPTSVR